MEVGETDKQKKISVLNMFGLYPITPFHAVMGALPSPHSSSHLPLSASNPPPSHPVGLNPVR